MNPGPLQPAVALAEERLRADLAAFARTEKANEARFVS